MTFNRRALAYRFAPVLALVASILLPAAAFAQPANSKDPWMTYWPQVEALAKKQDKVILIYFKITGEDWCEKLDKDVMTTSLFLNWAQENVMMMKVDFDPNQSFSPTVKKHFRDLKEKYAIKLAPTILFVNPDGQELARAQYDMAKLREKEPKGYPKTWVEYCKKIATERPTPKLIETIEGLPATQKYATEHQVAMLMIVTKNPTDDQKKKVDMLLGSAQFKQFADVSLAVTNMDWPSEFDPSPDAVMFKMFAKKHEMTDVPLQLVMWDPVEDRVATTIYTFSPTNLTPILRQMRAKLPVVPYRGEWLTDYRKARSIAVQQRRFVFLSFTDYNNSEFCQKIKKELYETELFKEYAKRYLVLVEVDLPKDGKGKDPALFKEHNQIADVFNIRGFPSIVILNEKGEKVATTGYLKGGPEPMLEELERIRKNDAARRDPASEW